MKKQSLLIFDYDSLIYKAACASENTSVKIVNKITGEEFIRKNRSEFFGRSKKTIGGELAEINKSKDTPLTVDDFLVFDQVEPEPIENALQIVKTIIKGICYKAGSKRYYGYLSGGGDVFRHDYATLQEYKGQRSDVKPTHLAALQEYVKVYHEGYPIVGIESDDMCHIDAKHQYKLYKKTGNITDKGILISIDKDAKQTPCFLWNPDKTFDEPEEIENTIGTIWHEKQNNLNIYDGRGRAWLYWQVAVGDVADNYKPNCWSEGKFGEASAWKALQGCATDKQYLEALIQYYKLMYPEPVTRINFRGDEITADWKYVMNEMFVLAKMLEEPDPNSVFTIDELFDRVGVKYD